MHYPTTKGGATVQPSNSCCDQTKQKENQKIKINVKLPSIIHEKGRCITVGSSCKGVDIDSLEGVRDVEGIGDADRDLVGCVTNQTQEPMVSPGIVGLNRNHISPITLKGRSLSDEENVLRCKKQVTHMGNRCFKPSMVLHGRSINVDDFGAVRCSGGVGGNYQDTTRSFRPLPQIAVSMIIKSKIYNFQYSIKCLSVKVMDMTIICRGSIARNC